MPDDKPASSAENHAMILGELRGQMREMVHGINNLSAKFDGLSREVIGFGPMAEEIGQLKVKVAALEADAAKREGANGVLVAIAKSPAFAWIGAALLAAWAFLSGKIQA